MLDLRAAPVYYVFVCAMCIGIHYYFNTNCFQIIIKPSTMNFNRSSNLVTNSRLLAFSGDAEDYPRWAIKFEGYLEAKGLDKQSTLPIHRKCKKDGVQAWLLL
eukprot:GHVQ01027239.1.p1 GENE.GHVQ01027239.1~~GHVQ01027239.1.p1  ORF type:complete len:103 (-),score=3.02 GHVQ01027239.1:142-450(-)